MIKKIGVEESTKFHPKADIQKNRQVSPNFEGKKTAAVVAGMVTGMQYLERNPMLNVSVLDFGTAIGPRTVFDSFTNIFSGFETLCRESFGLIINCLAPGFVAIGAGKLLDKFSIKTGAKDMANCYASSDTIGKISKMYTESNGNISEVYGKLLSEIHGLDGNKLVKYADLVDTKEFGKKLAEATDSKAFNGVIEELLTKTHVNDNIKYGKDGQFLKDISVSSLLNNTRKFFEEYNSTGGKETMEKFAQKALKMIKGKSILGLAIILPIAGSMQFINRWMTEKLSGVKGAPIYDDFREARENPELHERLKEHSKEGLLKQKIISMSMMAGVAIASIVLSARSKMDMKSLARMFEFKGKYPTMDQARAIAGTTFTLRIAAADDTNEVRESRGRDIATFLSLYFFGDYAGKLAASIIEAKTGTEMLNRSVVSPKDANILTKFKNWVLNAHIKSSNELMFTNKDITAKAQKYRSVCQLVNLLSSFAILGIIIYQRKQTQKKHELAKEEIKRQLEVENSKKQEKPEMAVA